MFSDKFCFIFIEQTILNMKQNYLNIRFWSVLMILTMAILSLSFTTSANNPWEEIIIQVPKLTAKNEAQIRTELTTNKGVQYVSTCMKLKVVSIRVNRNVQENNLFILNAFKTLQLEYFLKEGTIAQIHQACGISTNDNNQN